MFRFNRNIETLFFGIEAKQSKQTVSEQTEKNSFGCFESKLVSKDTLAGIHLLTELLGTHERMGNTSCKDDLMAYALYILTLFASDLNME